MKNRPRLSAALKGALAQDALRVLSSADSGPFYLNLREGSRRGKRVANAIVIGRTGTGKSLAMVAAFNSLLPVRVQKRSLKS